MHKALDDEWIDIVRGEFERNATDTKDETEEQRVDIDRMLDKMDDDYDITAVYHNIKED